MNRVEEVPLGGNLSGSVRIGDTVHRRAGSWTPAVHALLEHLQRVGFGAAPEVLGMDDQGRAVLSFIPGELDAGWPESQSHAAESRRQGLAAKASRFALFCDAYGGGIARQEVFDTLT